jgi:AcrR family transcriptional regulator
MKAVQQTAPGLRDAHRNLTRARILDAAIELLKRENLEALTLADIAAQASVTERTLYRHFSTRDELLKAVWPRLQARVGSSGFADSAAGLAEQPLWLFPNFDAEDGAVRASLFSPAGRELRRALNPERQRAIRKGVREARPDLKEPAVTRLCAVIHLVGSAYGWAIMKEAWGLDGSEAGRAAAEATTLLLALEEPAKPRGKSKRKTP